MKWTPGLAKEFALVGRNLEQHGFSTTYLLSEGYKQQLARESGRFIYVTGSADLRRMIVETAVTGLWQAMRIRRILQRTRPDLVLIYNAHPLNAVVAWMARRLAPAGIRVLYLHEPYKPDKSSFGLVGRLVYAMVELIQSATLRQVNRVVLLSEHGRTLFEQRYSWPRHRVHVASLMIPDEDRRTRGARRNFVTVVGTINKDRDIREFLALVEYCSEREMAWRFQVVTRSDIRSRLSEVSERALSVLRVINKDVISDEEIANAAGASFALILPHRSVTQSGNIPVAFRVGTPVVARDLPGFRQHIDDRKTGVLVPVDHTPSKVCAALLYIHENFDSMSAAARKAFERDYDERNWSRWYRWLISPGRRATQ